jgi:hypothetical protein
LDTGDLIGQMPSRNSMQNTTEEMPTWKPVTF